MNIEIDDDMSIKVNYREDQNNTGNDSDKFKFIISTYGHDLNIEKINDHTVSIEIMGNWEISGFFKAMQVLNKIYREV